MRLFCSVILLAGCSPQAADEYAWNSSEREPDKAPAKVLPSPDTAGALWFASGTNHQLLYGLPGERPMLVIACENSGTTPTLRIVRRAPTDAGAKALMAAIGNGQIQRLPVDASWTGSDWVWEGVFMAADPRMAVFAGSREVEVTVPGGGTLLLKPSALPGELIGMCASSTVQNMPEPTQLNPNL